MKTLAVLLAALATAVAGCVAQSGAGGMTAEQGDAILAELKDIKRMLLDQRAKVEPDAGAPVKLRLDDVGPNAIGAANAPVTLIEFTDYQCPFCKRFHDRTWPELKRRYVDAGKVRFVVRDMPLGFHSQALPAAIAARCAGEQGRFAQVFEALFAAPELTPEAIRRITDGAGLARDAFEQCSKKSAVRAAIDADTAEAERLGITGTPGFVIAQKSGGKLEGALVIGAQSTEVFTSRIDALLATPHAN